MSTYIPSDAESDRRITLTADKVVELNRQEQYLGTHTRSYAAQVLKFMVAFDQLPTPRGQLVSPEDFKLAEKLIDEEVGELNVAFHKFLRQQSLENAVELLDGAVDSIYVIIWAMNKFGLPFDAAFDEVQRSNMAKLNADGTYTKNENGKVQKPATWTPPNLFDIVAKHRDDAIWNGNIRVGDKT